MLNSLMGSAAQGPFAEAYSQGKWSKALHLWGNEIAKKGFAQTDNGKALLGLILFANGFEVMGVETLFSVSNPETLSSQLKAEWKKVAIGSAPVWKLARVRWHPAWTQTFGVAAKVRATAQRMRQESDLKDIEQMITETVPDTAERAWLQWQMVTSLALKGEVSEAAKLLGPLLKYKVNPVSKDLMTLTAARMLYKRNFLDVAAKYYTQIPKDSSYWFEAQEEMGWIYLRKGRSQDVIAQTNTFAYTDFGSLVGPESYYLRALGQLQICDYPNAVKTLMGFKHRFRQRAQQMLKVKNGGPESLEALIRELAQPKMSVKAAGQLVAKLPRKILRDEETRQLVQTYIAVEKENAAAHSKMKTAPWLGVMLQGRMKSLKQEMNGRVQKLASRELSEIDDVLTKMQVVEVEIIQQVDSAAKKLAKSDAQPKSVTKKGKTGNAASDSLIFKHKASEIWFDELANYKVNVKQFCKNGGK